jgi:hypothetical protein
MKKLLFSVSSLLFSAILSNGIAQSTTTSTVTESKETAVKKEGEQVNTLTPSTIKPVRKEVVKTNAVPVLRVTPVTPASGSKEEENQSTPPNQK